MSEKETKKLFGGITNISDDIIENAQTTPAKGQKSSSAWEKWGVIAACFCLAAVGVFAVIRGGDGSGKETIMAEDLVWSTGLGGNGTTNYAIKGFAEGEGIPVSPVKDNTDAGVLSVYRSLNAQNSNDTYHLLLTWAEELSEQAKDNLGIDLDYNTEHVLLNGEKYDSNMPLSDQYMYYLSVKLYYGDAALTLSCTSEGNVTYYELDGIETLYEAWAQEPFSLLEQPKDEDVVAAVEPVVSFVNDLTQKEYTLDTPRIHRMWDDTVVLMGFVSAKASGTELSSQMFGQPESLTVRLKQDNDGIYGLDLVAIFEDYYEYIGDYELISLSEAEEYLHRGYTFGGVQCPVCKVNNPEVDFSEYDLVQVEYYSNLMEYALPYYTFYQYVGTREGQDGEGVYVEYAVAYVPAVKVEGMEEYFKVQEEQHEDAGHSAQ